MIEISNTLHKTKSYGKTFCPDLSLMVNIFTEQKEYKETQVSSESI